MDLVFEAVSFSDVFSVDKTSLVNMLSSLLSITDGSFCTHIFAKMGHLSASFKEPFTVVDERFLTCRLGG